MKRLSLALGFLILLLTGCSGDTSGKIFRMDISGPVSNMDPQFTTDTTARMILGNLMEGLVERSASGGIEPGVAKEYSVSAEGLTYTFHLREDAAWSDGSPVTAADFVFAFRRMFEFSSPLAGSYRAIQNADEVLDGTLSSSQLGLRASDPHTLTIRLTRPDPFFLELLTDPAASPCNEAFFYASRGRYGLEKSFVLSNGPFQLDSWDNSRRIQIRPNEYYASELPTVSGGVNFHIGRDALAQFVDGKTDLAFLSFDQQDKLDSSRNEISEIQKTVWCIVFNQNHPIWGSALLRQGLAHAIDHELVGEKLPLGFVPASVLVPQAIQIGEIPYRDLAFQESPLSFDTQEASRLFELGLRALERDHLPTATTIVIPELAAASLNIGEVQQGWQKYLGAYLNFVVESPGSIQARFRTGDYQMLVMPFTPESSGITSLLDVFTSDSPQNYFGYRSYLYNDLMNSARSQTTVDQAVKRYVQAEKMILSDAVVIPLYFETTYFALGSTVEDLRIASFGDRICFKYARRAG